MRFIDLQAQYHTYQSAIDAAIAEVVQSTSFINGSQVKELEKRLAEFVGTREAVGVSSGTSALRLALMAWNIGPGDEVITTPFTFFATAEVIGIGGATPVFVDIQPDSFNIDPALIEQAITPRTKAIVPVSLYGQCCDFDAINAIGKKHGIPVLEDACQSFGASWHGKRSCSLTTGAAISFFPSKPLGCYGDGGMFFTDDPELANTVRIMSQHGQTARYQHGLLGINARLDTLQAAILLAKLPHFTEEIAARQHIAQGYAERLGDLPITLPIIKPENESVFAQFTIRVKNRPAVQKSLQESGIPTAVHYPMALHRQPVFADMNLGEGSFPHAEQASQEVLSLPMHPFLTSEQLDTVAAAVKVAVSAG